HVDKNDFADAFWFLGTGPFEALPDTAIAERYAASCWCGAPEEWCRERGRSATINVNCMQLAASTHRIGYRLALHGRSIVFVLDLGHARQGRGPRSCTVAADRESLAANRRRRRRPQADRTAARCRRRQREFNNWLSVAATKVGP